MKIKKKKFCIEGRILIFIILSEGFSGNTLTGGSIGEQVNRTGQLLEQISLQRENFNLNSAIFNTATDFVIDTNSYESDFFFF